MSAEATFPGNAEAPAVPSAEPREGHAGRSKVVGARTTKAAPETLSAVRRRAIHRLLLLVFLLVALSIASPLVQQLSPTKSYAVASESMDPGIPKGSLVVTRERPVDVGDVVVYWSPTGEYQVHRIVERIQQGDQVFYRTAGDANEAEDAFLVPAEDIQGEVVRHSPLMGYLWLMPGWFQFVGFSSAILLYLGLTAWEARAWLTRRLGWLTGLGCVFLVLILGAPALAGISSEPPRTWHAVDVTPTLFPLASGTMATTSVSTDRNSATVDVPAPRLWKEIPMWNCKKEAACTNTLSPGASEEVGSRARIDMAHYSPVPTAYFEAYVAAPSGATAEVHLYDTTNNVEVAGSRVTTTSTTLTLVRSAAFSLSGVKDYTIRTAHTGSGQGGEIAHARLLFVQDSPTKTVEQIRLSQGTEEATTQWAVPARAAKWRFDGASMDGITTAQFEMIAEVDGDMLTASRVRLIDRTAGTIVTTLTVGVLDTQPKRFISTDIKASLIDGHEYEIEVRRGEGLLSNRLHLYVARVIIQQSGFSETVRYVDLSWKTTTTENTFTNAGYPGRYHMETEYGGRQGYFEATMRNSGVGTTSTRLHDATTGAAVPDSTVLVTGSTMTRARSGAIDLGTTGATYTVRFQASSGTAEIRQAWLIVLQGPGKTYDHVLDATHDVVEGCTWSVTVHLISSSGLARLRGATIAIRNGATSDQVRVASGAVTLLSGDPVTVAYPERLDHVVTTDPTGPGTSTLFAEQRSHCMGTGIRMTQPLTYVFG